MSSIECNWEDCKLTFNSQIKFTMLKLLLKYAKYFTDFMQL